MSSDETLREYELSWQEEHKQRKNAEERAQFAENELLALRHRNHELDSQAKTNEARISQLVLELQNLNEQHRKQDLENAGLWNQLKDLQARMDNRRFWRRDFEEQLALEFYAFDVAIAQVQCPGDWKALFERWHLEVMEGMGRLLAGKQDEAFSENLRRKVLAQWVFLRWLEIYNLYEQPRV